MSVAEILIRGRTGLIVSLPAIAALGPDRAGLAGVMMARDLSVLSLRRLALVWAPVGIGGCRGWAG
jgi:hypothetical protein